jgi:DNA-binding response OmpR family regulator
VNCTVTPQDDLVVARLQATLRDVQRLDLLFDDSTSGARWRFEDVVFDPAADEVVLANNMAELRRLPVTTQRVQLLAVEPGIERVIGDYTFNHTP